MPLWAGLSTNEIPTELGKLLTGQDYGGDAKKCMDAVAEHDRRQGQGRRPALACDGKSWRRRRSSPPLLFETGRHDKRSRHRHRQFDLGDQGDRLGSRAAGPSPRDAWRSPSPIRGRDILSRTRPSGGARPRRPCVMSPREVDPGAHRRRRDLQSARDLRAVRGRRRRDAARHALARRARAAAGDAASAKSFGAERVHAHLRQAARRHCPAFTASSGCAEHEPDVFARAGADLPRSTAI